MSDDLILWGYWRSTATWRVRIALELKGIKYEYRPINLVKGEQRDDEFLSINPDGLVPVLGINVCGKAIFLRQSLAIINWIDCKYSYEPFLIKRSDPFEEAHIWELSLLIACDIHPLQNLRQLKKIDDEKERMERGRHIIEEGLKSFELLLEGKSGSCTIGDSISMSDLTLIPQLYNAERFGICIEKCFPILNRIKNNLSLNSAFINAHPDSMSDCTTKNNLFNK